MSASKYLSALVQTPMCAKRVLEDRTTLVVPHVLTVLDGSTRLADMEPPPLWTVMFMVDRNREYIQEYPGHVAVIVLREFRGGLLPPDVLSAAKARGAVRLLACFVHDRPPPVLPARADNMPDHPSLGLPRRFRSMCTSPISFEAWPVAMQHGCDPYAAMGVVFGLIMTTPLPEETFGRDAGTWVERISWDGLPHRHLAMRRSDAAVLLRDATHVICLN